MAYKVKVLLLVITFVVVYNNSCCNGSSSITEYSDREDELEQAERFLNILEESSNMFYKLAQSVMKRKEFENCTMVLIYDENRNDVEHLSSSERALIGHSSSEIELIIQQNSRLRPIIYVTWKKMRRAIRKRFTSSPLEFKFSERCYVVFGEFIKELNIAKLKEGIYNTFLPNAKFIFRLIPSVKEKWPTMPTKPMIIGPSHAEYSWNILEVVVAYNKLNEMRLLLYSFCPHCFPSRDKITLPLKRGISILSAGMGSDGIIKEYRSSLFPQYTTNFHHAHYHLIYNPSTLSSVADMEHSISREVDQAFHFINLVAKQLKMSVEIRNLKYEYEVGSKSKDGTWNGYIGQLMSSHNSIGLAFSPHRKYNDDVRVSHPYSTFSIGMIYMDAAVSNNISVWVAISQTMKTSIFTTVIFALSIGSKLCAIEYCQKRFFPALLTKENHKHKGWDRFTWMHKLMEYSWLPVKIWFQQAFKLRHLRLKTALVFIGSWWFSAIYYSTFVKTFLISTMTHAPKSKLVTSLADLMEKEEWQWGTFLKPSVWSDLVGNSSYKELTGEMQYFDSYSSCIEKVSESKFACIGTARVLKAFIVATKQDNSHLVYVDTELFPSYLTFAFQKHSPFADVVSRQLQSIVEAAVEHDHMKPAFKLKTLEGKEHETGGSNAKHKPKNPDLKFRVKGEDVDLSFKEQLVDSFEELFEEAEVEDIFSFVFMGFLLAFLVFLAEQIYFSIRNVRNPPRQMVQHFRLALPLPVNRN